MIIGLGELYTWQKLLDKPWSLIKPLLGGEMTTLYTLSFQATAMNKENERERYNLVYMRDRDQSAPEGFSLRIIATLPIFLTRPRIFIFRIDMYSQIYCIFDVAYNVQ